jgi:DNA polymerase
MNIVPVNIVDFAVLQRDMYYCSKCGLCTARHVYHEGNKNADIMIVGEGPGSEEVRQGKPFVGPAGQLLSKILQAANINRQDIFITNVVRCQPPGNRTPTIDEIRACRPFLLREIALVQPKAIIALGATAGNALIHEDFKITKERGQWFSYNGIRIMPTFHPAYLLRKTDGELLKAKQLVWKDFCMVINYLKGV